MFYKKKILLLEKPFNIIIDLGKPLFVFIYHLFPNANKPESWFGMLTGELLLYKDHAMKYKISLKYQNDL